MSIYSSLTSTTTTTTTAAAPKPALGHLFHEANIIVFGAVTVFLEIGTFVFWHRGEKVFDQVIGNEGVAEVEFGDVRLLRKKEKKKEG